MSSERKKQFGGVKTHQVPFRLFVCVCVSLVCVVRGVFFVWYAVCGVYCWWYVACGAVWLQRGRVLLFYDV